MGECKCLLLLVVLVEDSTARQEELEKEKHSKAGALLLYDVHYPSKASFGLRAGAESTTQCDEYNRLDCLIFADPQHYFALIEPLAPFLLPEALRMTGREKEAYASALATRSISENEYNIIRNRHL